MSTRTVAVAGAARVYGQESPRASLLAAYDAFPVCHRQRANSFAVHPVWCAVSVAV